MFRTETAVNLRLIKNGITAGVKTLLRFAEAISTARNIQSGGCFAEVLCNSTNNRSKFSNRSGKSNTQNNNWQIIHTHRQRKMNFSTLSLKKALK